MNKIYNTNEKKYKLKTYNFITLLFKMNIHINEEACPFPS